MHIGQRLHNLPHNEQFVLLRNSENNTSLAVPKVFVKDLNIDYSSVLGSGTFGTVCKGNWDS
jgi:hypothetical protein